MTANPLRAAGSRWLLVGAATAALTPIDESFVRRDDSVLVVVAGTIIIGFVAGIAAGTSGALEAHLRRHGRNPAPSACLAAALASWATGFVAFAVGVAQVVYFRAVISEASVAAGLEALSDLAEDFTSFPAHTAWSLGFPALAFALVTFGRLRFDRLLAQVVLVGAGMGAALVAFSWWGPTGPFNLSIFDPYPRLRLTDEALARSVGLGLVLPFLIRGTEHLAARARAGRGGSSIWTFNRGIRD